MVAATATMKADDDDDEMRRKQEYRGSLVGFLLPFQRRTNQRDGEKESERGKIIKFLCKPRLVLYVSLCGRV